MRESEAINKPVSGCPDGTRRLRNSHVEWVADRLNSRDWKIIEVVTRLRLVSSQQLERLYFSTLSGHACTVVRGRVLRRLVRWQVLHMLPRRVGGSARGSAGAVFALGPTGIQLCHEHQAAMASMVRVRRPATPITGSVRHALAVSELYVSLVELARTQGVEIVTFEAEPACWWPNGLGGFLKPDAYTVLTWGTVREHWWIEVDLATESLPIIKRKLQAYLHFVERGQLGPNNLVPRVLMSTISPARCMALRSVIMTLPAPAADLFVICTDHESAPALLHSLQT